MPAQLNLPIRDMKRRVLVQKIPAKTMENKTFQTSNTPKTIRRIQAIQINQKQMIQTRIPKKKTPNP
jgi:hypothetical protein